MKKIYTNESMFLVTNMKNLVEEAGIEVCLKNEFVQGALGEVPVFETWPELWVVNDIDVETAKRIITAAEQNTKTEDWFCSSCSEQNDPAFEICWNCQTPCEE